MFVWFINKTEFNNYVTKIDLFPVIIFMFSEQKIKQRLITIFLEKMCLKLFSAVLRQVFDHFDADKSGMISISELDKVLAKLNVKLSKEQLQKLMRDSDKDGEYLHFY